MSEGDAAYAALWLSELGAYVPEHRSAPPDEPRRVPAPDDHDRPGQFTTDPTRDQGQG